MDNPHAHYFLASLDSQTSKVLWAISFTGKLLNAYGTQAHHEKSTDTPSLFHS